jgi:cytochrome c biogenesis protein CcmG/thiol:disulfide interchange protein DsbE
MKIRLLFFIPILLFLLILGAFLWGLKPDRDPGALPSVLLGKPIPTFKLPDLYQEGQFVDDQQFRDKTVHLVNFFASWCLPCKAEHPLLTDLAESGTLHLTGIAWKDKPEAARKWLAQHGNPYDWTLSDENGRSGIDWGVYGVPETYVVDGKGVVRFRYAGPLTPEVIANDILPLVERLKQ